MTQRSSMGLSQTSMMKQLFEQTIWRSWSAFASGVAMLSKRAPMMMKLDGAISRTAHMLSRPVLYQDKSKQRAGTQDSSSGINSDPQHRCTGNK